MKYYIGKSRLLGKIGNKGLIIDFLGHIQFGLVAILYIGII